MTSNIKIERICMMCKEPFTARTTVTQCCSDNCAKKLYKLKKREEKIKGSNHQTTIMKVMPVDEWAKRQFFSISELTQLLGVSRWTISRAIKNKQLVADKIGKRVIIARKEINKFLKIE